MSACDAVSWLAAALVTCPRPNRYVDIAVRTYLADAQAPPLQVFADGPVPLPETPRIVLATDEAVARRGSPYARARLNTCRSFAYLAAQPCAAVHLEDDAMLAAGWVAKLRRAYEDASHAAGERFVLAMFSAASGRPVKRYPHLRSYGAKKFRGLVGVCMPHGTMVELAAVVARRRAECADDAVHWYLKSTSTAVFETNPHLVQHVGDVSTTGLVRVIRSPAFDR